MGLNERQQRFVEEYLVDLNASAAARRAGYSEKTAYAQGHDLLKHPEVAAAIAEAQAARAERTQITADRVLEELAAIAFADSRDYVTWGPDGATVTPSAELGDAAARAVREVKVEVDELEREDGSVVRKVQASVKTHDKMRALELLGKHVGVLKEKVEVEHGPFEVRLSFDPRARA